MREDNKLNTQEFEINRKNNYTIVDNYILGNKKIYRRGAGKIK